MLVALLRCTGVALVMGVVTTAAARGGSVPLKPQLIADEPWSEETAPADPPPLAAQTPATGAAYRPAIPVNDSPGPSSIMIPLPDPLWSGALGLGGLGLALASRRILPPA